MQQGVPAPPTADKATQTKVLGVLYPFFTPFLMHHYRYRVVVYAALEDKDMLRRILDYEKMDEELQTLRRDSAVLADEVMQEEDFEKVEKGWELFDVKHENANDLFFRKQSLHEDVNDFVNKVAKGIAQASSMTER